MKNIGTLCLKLKNNLLLFQNFIKIYYHISCLLIKKKTKTWIIKIKPIIIFGMKWVENIVRNYVTPAIIFLIIFVISLYFNAVFITVAIFKYIRCPSEHYWTTEFRPIPPKCLDDPQLGNHCFIQLENVKLHYVEARQRERPLMILIHGFPEFWYSWRHQIKEFSKDYWVVAIDMRGYGYSEKPQGYKYYRVMYLVEDIKNLIEALGQEKCILAGHNWGGFIAWYFISWYPQSVEKFVILNAPHPNVFWQHLTTNLTQLKMVWYIFFYHMPCFPELALQMEDMKMFNYIFSNKQQKCVLNDEDMEAYKFMFGKPGAFTCPINYYRANFITCPQTGTGIADSKDYPKGMLIFGEDDIALDAAPLIAKSKQYIEHLQTELISGAGHFVHQDQPEKVNELMRAFLELD